MTPTPGWAPKRGAPRSTATSATAAIVRRIVNCTFGRRTRSLIGARASAPRIARLARSRSLSLLSELEL